MLLKQCVALNVCAPKIRIRLLSRYLSTKLDDKTHLDIKSGKKMSGWQIHSYSDGIQYSDNIKVPTIKDSKELLIKVNSTSVNPIDIAMAGELFASHQHIYYP